MPSTEYIRGVNEAYARINFDPYHWITNITSPWTPMTKKLSNSRVALVSGGGISLKSQTPYQLTSIGDLSYREIPGDARAQDMVINSAFFKHDDTDKDINNLFPIEILQDMARDGYIGEVSPVNYVCGVGRIYEPELSSVYIKKVLPEIVGKLKAAEVDVCLFCCG